MAVELSAKDLTIHTQMVAESPALDVAPGVWQLGDTSPNGDPVASTTLAAGPGFMGDLDLTLVRAASSTGDSQVAAFYRHLDGSGGVLASGASAPVTVDATEDVLSLAIPAAPAGTAACKVGLVSAMAPPGPVTRINRYPDPRATTLTNLIARLTWSIMSTTMASTISGLTTCARAYVSASDTGTGRGISLYDSTDRVTPQGLPGYPVSGMVGQTITVSVYVRSTKAATFTLSARGYAGTAWMGAAESGTPVAVSASTWTRLRVTYTVAAGATHMCLTAQATDSVAWVSGDFIDLTAILIENGATLRPYFDGGTVALETPPAASRWEGAADNSRSLMWASTIPGGTTVQAVAGEFTHRAACEELVGVALERDLRRTAADIWNDAETLITAGTAALLSGQLTYLCRSLAEALALDALYRTPALLTLSNDSTSLPADLAGLAGLTHRAVGRIRINPERALPGKTPRWQLVVDFREQAS